MVPLGALRVGVRRHLRHAVGAVLHRRDLHGPGDRPQRRRRLPAPAGLPAGRIAASRRRDLPAGRRPAPAAAARHRARPGRTHLRPQLVGCLADLAAVRQPGAVPPEGPSVPPGHLVLRLHLPVHPAGARLSVRRRPAVAGDGGGGARAVRRAAAAGPAGAGDHRRPDAAVHPAGGVRPAQGRRLLVRSLRHRLLPARDGDHRGVLHRRQRGPAGQDGARGDRDPVRGAVLRRRGPPQRDAARRRVRPAGPVGDPHRRGLPGGHPAVRGEAERAGQGVQVHRQGDQEHPARLRRQRRTGDLLSRRPQRASPASSRARWWAWTACG